MTTYRGYLLFYKEAPKGGLTFRATFHESELAEKNYISWMESQGHSFRRIDSLIYDALDERWK
jgi:hypothetical protein